MRLLVLLLTAALLTGCTGRAFSDAAVPQQQPGQDSSLAFWVPFSYPSNEHGFFYPYWKSGLQGYFLTRYDFEDMTQHIVCDVPGCTHTDESCGAFLENSEIVVLPDAVYTFQLQRDKSGIPTELSTMERRNADGTDPQPVATIATPFIFGANEQFLYGFSNGDFVRISRQHGIETTLLFDGQDLYSSFGSILGVWDGQFVAIHWGEKPTQNISLNLLSIEGEQTPIATLNSKMDAHTWKIYKGATMTQDTVCYVDCDGTIQEYELSTGKTRVRTKELCSIAQADVPIHLRCVADGYLLADVWSPENGNQSFIITPQGDCLPVCLAIEDRDTTHPALGIDQPLPTLVQPVHETPHGLLVQNARQFFWDESFDVNGNSVSFETFVDIYALMDPQDYFASRPVYREFAPILNN